MLVGDTILDFVSVRDKNGPKGLYAQYGGGAIANVARHLANFELATELVTAFAPDPFGTALRRALLEGGVSLNYAQTIPDQETPLCFISNASDGERFFLHRGGDPFGAMQAPRDLPLMTFDWLVFGISSMRTIDQRFLLDQLIQRQRGWVVCDPGTCPSWWGEPSLMKMHLLERISKIDILKCSRPEATWLTECQDPAQAAHRLTKMGARIGIVTDGANGIYYQYGGNSQHVQSPLANAVDTTGAGDAALAGILHALVKAQRPPSESALQTAIECGAELGANTVKFQGAGPWQLT